MVRDDYGIIIILATYILMYACTYIMDVAAATGGMKMTQYAVLCSEVLCKVNVLI